MGKVADPLRKYAESIPGGLGGDALMHIADQIDQEHEYRMRVARREIRRKCFTDVRWAVNLLENVSRRKDVREKMEDFFA